MKRTTLILAWALWLALALLVMLVILPPRPAAAEQMVFVLVDEGSVLNVRMHPRLGSDIEFVMERGETLTVEAIRGDGWANVSRAGDSGYCRIEYLTDQPPGDPQPYTATVGQVRLRRVLGWMTDSEGTRWARVKDGFVMARYLAAAAEDGAKSQ